MVYTDGACSGNPGPGGWGAVIIDNFGKRQEISGAFQKTTNNRMELMAVLKALEKIPDNKEVYITTDSQYVVNAVHKDWLSAWQDRNWRNAQKKPVANRDLWERLIKLLKTHRTRFEWIRGHTGHVENECCDRLAVSAYSQGPFQIDDGYCSGGLW